MKNLFSIRVLLDQLLQYEPVSDDEETMTSYSASDDETADKPKQVSAIHDTS